MLLQSLHVRNFRSYTEASVEFAPGINLIQGANGEGKTNLLEALYLLSTGKSFRTPHLSDLIKEGEKFFFIEAKFIKDGATQSLKIGYEEDKRKIFYNQTLLQNFSHLLGIIPFVLQAPFDIDIIAGAPADRRRFLNIHLCQTDPLYVHYFTRYARALKQRNVLLKNKTEETMSSWEQELAESASYITAKREEVLLNFPSLAEGFTIEYAPSVKKRPTHSYKDELLSVYLKQRKKEFILGTTLSGPHRDDINVLLHKKEARLFASEGQKRTFVTALRFAEWTRTASIVGASPLMAIDDFGMHFDAKRQEELLEQLEQFDQVLLTSPKPSSHLEKLASRSFIVENSCVSKIV